MTAEEYYEILKRNWELVDQNNINDIKAYNEFKRKLREELEYGKNNK